MIYKQTRPMQWITLYYNGNDSKKMEMARNGRQMRKFIRYANVMEEIKEEQLEVLHDTKNRYVGITPNDLIVMFENNY